MKLTRFEMHNHEEPGDLNIICSVCEAGTLVCDLQEALDWATEHLLTCTQDVFYFEWQRDSDTWCRLGNAMGKTVLGNTVVNWTKAYPDIPYRIIKEESQ